MARKKTFTRRIKSFNRAAGKSFKGFSKFTAKSLKDFDRSTNRLERSIKKSALGKRLSKAFGPKRPAVNYGYKTVARKGAEIHENIYPPEAYQATIASLARRGLPIPSGPELTEAVRKEAIRRLAAVNFLRSGWLAAIGIFARRIGKAAKKNAHRNMDKYGGAAPARISNNPFATFFNTAFSRITTTAAGIKYAETGLQLAIDSQVADMQKYIARKQQERTNSVFRKLAR